MLLEIDPSLSIHSGHCWRCGIPVIAAGDPADTSSLVCERCAADGYPGVRGHALPDYAIAFARATDTHLNAVACLEGARSWDWQARVFEEAWGRDDDDAAAARKRAQALFAAAAAFDAVAAEQEAWNVRKTQA